MKCAVVQGADSSTIQRLFRELVDAAPRSLRVAGLIEEAAERPDGRCGPGELRSLVDGSRYALFQDLGSGSTACSLDAGGVIEACHAVCGDIAQGCDLVVLSKFGKLEAENGRGLMAAFVAAAEAAVPVLTSVSPRWSAAWERFAGPGCDTLPPDFSAVQRWSLAALSDSATRRDRTAAR